MPLNVHIYPSTLKNESRILKITKSLAENGVFERILVIGVLEDGLPETEMIDPCRQILRLPRRMAGNHSGFIAKIARSFEWFYRLIYALRGSNVECINCHSLSVLPVCVLLKLLKGATLVYDTHELETESAGSHGIRRELARVVERILIPFADVVVVVSESISRWYKEAYGLTSVPVIVNTPPCSKVLPAADGYLKEKFNIGHDEVVFVYLGVLGGGRGIEILLEAFARTTPDKHMVFIGHGVLECKIKEYQDKFGNIHFHSSVPPDRIGECLAGADVGVSIIENICLSYYFCLPNKLFEYLSNGLPVLVSNFPEMERIVSDNGCGWSVPVEPGEIAKVIDTISFGELGDKRTKALECRSKYDWSVEQKALLAIYDELFPSKLILRTAYDNDN